MELKQHPLSAAFPAMSAEDFQALKDDIEANGQREPIIVLDGMVLDGWHRYRACADLGVKVQQFTFPAEDDPVAFVLSHNLHRRHLTASQRAAAVVACSSWAPAHRPKKAETISGFSRDKDMARVAGTSDRTIRDAKVAHKAGLTDAVKQGAMTAHEAAQVARGKPAAAPKPTQPPKAAKRELPAPVEPPADDQLSEAQHTIVELAQENDALRDKLAVESLMDSEEAKTQTAETIRELRALVKTLEAERDALKVSRDTYMRENSELKKQVSYWRKQAEKAAKPAKDAA